MTHARQNLEDTAWAKEVQRCAPDVYEEALAYARDPDLRVEICRTDESCAPSEWLWAIAVVVDGQPTDFWLWAEPTRQEAEALCERMGWRIVE